MSRFRYSSVIPAPVEAVFAFHERPDAFELLSPGFPQVRVLRRKGGLEAGSRLEVEMRFGPLRIKWIALHLAYEENKLFVDEQVYGPFRRWVHRHEFEEADGGTRLTDKVEFSLPGGFPVNLLLGWLVRLQLWTMFRHRHRVTRSVVQGARAVTA